MHWTEYAADPTLAAFVPLDSGGTRMLLRRGYEEHAPLPGFSGAPPNSRERVTGGRQAHPVVALPSGERVVVRAYRRGGAMRHLNRSRYFIGHRAFEELRATERARRCAVRVPTVIAAAERGRGIGYTATLATLWIPDAEEGASWLSRSPPEERIAMLREAGRQIARMHDAGVAHPDLNLRNLLIREKGEGKRKKERSKPREGGPIVYLLDFDKARLFAGPVPPTRRARDLRRLARSARKLAISTGAEEWRAMRNGYGPAWPLEDRG